MQRIARLIRHGWAAVRWLLRLRGPSASAAIALALLAIALNTLPLHLLPRTTQQWRLPAGAVPFAAAAGTELPVFCMSQEGVPTHCGLARRQGEGLAFTAYRSGLPPDASIPVLAGADLGLLWALADPRGKAEVRISAIGLEQQLAGAVRDITRSPAWQQDYRPKVHQVLTGIAQQAWSMPSTQSAFLALIAAIQPMVASQVADEIGPAVAPYLADAVWALIATNSTQVFSLIGGGRPDLSPLSAAFTAALRDPAVQRVLGRLGPKIMALPQMELLSERLLANLAEIAQHDPEIFDLATRIATDRRLGQSLGHLRDDAGAFFRQTGQVMWGLGEGRALNALAGVALKSTLMGGAQPLILLIDPDSAIALERALPGGVVLLVPDTTT